MLAMNADQFNTLLETLRTSDNARQLAKLVEATQKGNEENIKAQAAFTKKLLEGVYKGNEAVVEKMMADPERTKNRQITKPSKFSSKDGKEWRNWRSNFSICMKINRWSHQRGRREAAVAMEGDAKDVVNDIPLGDTIAAGSEDALDVELLLNLYEGRFLPRAATDYAAVEFENAGQNEGEETVAWHARCRNLFRRAYPEVAEDMVNQSRQLRHKFVLGLRDRLVKQFTWRANREEYTQVLDEALLQTAGSLCIPDSGSSANFDGSSGSAVLAIGQSGEKLSCHFCLKKGHKMLECRSFLAAQKYAREGGRRGRGRGRGGSRGRGGYNNKKGKDGKASKDGDNERRVAKLEDDTRSEVSQSYHEHSEN